MLAEHFPDIAKAIRQSNVTSIAALMFDQTSWNIRVGYCTETEYWDYKVTGPSPGAGMPEEWANLAKDVLAFHNHKGGVIVFGVANGFKVVGYRSQLDSKLLNDRLRKYIGDKIWLDYHRLNIKEDQSHIGLVLVPPRGPVILRFAKDSPCDGNKYIFKKGDSAVREGDSSNLLKDIQADAFEARSRAPEFGQVYAIDEPFFRILCPEYHDFVERAEPCRLVEKALQDPRTSVVQITGVGGAGKTALATWAVLRAYEKKQFHFIVSTTAKDRELTAHGIQSLSPKLTSFESLLNSVLDVLGFPDMKPHSVEQKEKEVRELLQNSGGLLFVDNLETVDDPRIIQLLDDLPVGVRALVTSRRDTVRVAVFPIPLEWLKETEGRLFIKSLGHLPGLGFLHDLPDPDQLDEQLRKLVSAGWFKTPEEGVVEALRRYLSGHSVELQEKQILEDVEWGGCMAATEIVAVLDAGPPIHLDELGRLNLLNDFKELLVPQTVLDEALKYRPALPGRNCPISKLSPNRRHRENRGTAGGF